MIKIVLKIIDNDQKTTCNIDTIKSKQYTKDELILALNVRNMIEEILIKNGGERL